MRRWLVCALVGLGVIGGSILPTSAEPPKSKQVPRKRQKGRTKPAAPEQRPINDGDQMILFPGATGSSVIAVDVYNRRYEDRLNLLPGESFDRNYSAWEEARRLNDTLGMDQLVKKGAAIPVDANTRVLVIDHGVQAERIGKERVKVRIVDGPMKGKACWVPDTFLGHDPRPAN
jgi:hypothetical protein